MERTIRVKGTGNLNVKPDLTVISLVLKSVDRNYDKAMEHASGKLAALQSALGQVGFEKSALKTTRFNVSTEHESVRNKDGSYKSVFVGYSCVQGLKLEFDFDTKTLSKVLAAVSGCISEPELNVRFTVRDKNAVNEALLESAAANAREKAGILAKASGVKLGELTAILYDWAELEVYSDTRYEMEDRCLCMSSAANMDIEPDDIAVSDSATFVWAIG